MDKNNVKFKNFLDKTKNNLSSVKAKNIYFEILRTVIAILIAFGISSIIICLTSKQPDKALKIFFTAPMKTSFSRGKILIESVPLIFSGVAVCVMVKCGQFNMLGESMFYFGGLLGAVFAIYFDLPPIISPIISITLAGLIAGIIGLIPAELKAKLHVDEFVSSIMLNFVMLWVGIYLLTYKFIDESYSDIATKMIPENGKLTILNSTSQVSTSIFIALVLVILVWLFLYKTKWGYAIRMTGENQNFANYSGINANHAIVSSQVIGSAICGMGGASFILGNYYRFNWQALPGYGFDGFIIAIIARNNPLLVPIAALFFGYLRTGAMEMARLTDVASEVVSIIQAIIILLVGAQAFLYKLKQRSIKKNVKRDKVKGDAKC